MWYYFIFKNLVPCFNMECVNSEYRRFVNIPSSSQSYALLGGWFTFRPLTLCGAVCFQQIVAFVTTSDISRLTRVTNVFHIPPPPPLRRFLYHPGASASYLGIPWRLPLNLNKWTACTCIHTAHRLKSNISTTLYKWRKFCLRNHNTPATHYCILSFPKIVLGQKQLNLHSLHWQDCQTYIYQGSSSPHYPSEYRDSWPITRQSPPR